MRVCQVAQIALTRFIADELGSVEGGRYPDLIIAAILKDLPSCSGEISRYYFTDLLSNVAIARLGILDHKLD